MRRPKITPLAAASLAPQKRLLLGGPPPSVATLLSCSLMRPNISRGESAPHLHNAPGALSSPPRRT